jgi:hypothetical protein
MSLASAILNSWTMNRPRYWPNNAFALTTPYALALFSIASNDAFRSTPTVAAKLSIFA